MADGNLTTWLARPGVRRALAALAWLGFATSAAVHLRALLAAPSRPGLDALGLALHVGVFPLFFAAVVALRAEVGGAPGRVEVLGLLRRVPTWERALTAATFTYAFLNFFLALKAAGGRPSFQRIGSGHWMAFYLFPALAFGPRTSAAPEPVRTELGPASERAGLVRVARSGWPLRRWVVLLGGAVLLGKAGYDTHDAAQVVQAAAFVVPIALLFGFAPEVLGTGRMERRWSWRQPLGMGWMMASFLGAGVFATWFDRIPPQAIVRCEVHRSRGWHVSATLSGGRVVDLPYDAPADACAAPTCPPPGTIVERPRGATGTRVGERFHPADRSNLSSMAAVAGVGLLLLVAGLVMRRRALKAESVQQPR